MSGSTWMRCSACKRDIAFGAVHWVCSVSTCNRARMRLVFCSVACWDSHVAMLRHRDAWAVEAKAPSEEEWARSEEARGHEDDDDEREQTKPQFPPPGPQPAPARRLVDPPPARTAVGTASELAEAEREILIVVSKMKKYIKDRSGMNTSDAVAEALSDHVRAVCDDAIRAAASDGRKTVLDRDVPRPTRRL